MSNTEAYPLQWPEGWRRTATVARQPGRFNTKTRTGTAANLTIANAVERLYDQLDFFDARDIVISTNIEPTLSGVRPRSGVSDPADPGAAVYWTSKKGGLRRCIAIDRYTRVADNIAAIAATLDAMRAIDRHGGAEILDRAFTGFAALPSGLWWTVLGVTPDATAEQVRAAYHRLALEAHPDRGGSNDQMARINEAYDDYKRQQEQN